MPQHTATAWEMIDQFPSLKQHLEHHGLSSDKPHSSVVFLGALERMYTRKDTSASSGACHAAAFVLHMLDDTGYSFDLFKALCKWDYTHRRAFYKICGDRFPPKPNKEEGN